MRDLISRQSAIDALRVPKVSENWADEYELGEYKQWEKDVEAIKAVPSSPSEIIYCRNCKHRGEKPIADGRYWCELHDTFMYYCSDAERRTNE